MNSSKIYIILAIVVSTLVISYLHYSTIPAIHSLHDIYRAIYYIPVLLAALIFGLKGAFLSYMLVLVFYLPYIYKSWTGNFIQETDRLLHLSLQGLLAVLAGFLIDRDRRHRILLVKERYLAAIGQVATNIAHDMKNPLVTILGFVKRIKEGKGDSGEAIQAIMDSASNMQKLVSEMMDFSKPYQLNIQEKDIRAVIDRAYTTCKVKAEGKGVILLKEVPEGSLNIPVDALHIERALVNLISNSIDASAEGQSVTIKALPYKDYVAIIITDQGIGMDQATLDNIFIPFYTKKRTGTGLGLPITKKIVDAHIGSLQIKSKPGVGTGAIIRLLRNPVIPQKGTEGQG